MNNSELKAVVYSKLLSLGFNVRMNKRVTLSSRAKGFKTVTLDIAILDNHDKIIAIFYIGRLKPRKDTKFRSLKKRVFYIQSEDEIQYKLQAFKDWAIKKLYNII